MLITTTLVSMVYLELSQRFPVPSAAWDNNLMDTDKSLNVIIAACAASSACALHEASPDLVRRRMDRIFDKLKSDPIPATIGESYGLVDWSLARHLLFISLNQPSVLFPLVATGLAAAESGDG